MNHPSPLTPADRNATNTLPTQKTSTPIYKPLKPAIRTLQADQRKTLLPTPNFPQTKRRSKKALTKKNHRSKFTSRSKADLMKKYIKVENKLRRLEKLFLEAAQHLKLQTIPHKQKQEAPLHKANTKTDIRNTSKKPTCTKASTEVPNTKIVTPTKSGKNDAQKRREPSTHTDPSKKSGMTTKPPDREEIMTEGAENHSPTTSKRKICWWFINSTCSFGSKCKNIHPSGKDLDHESRSEEQVPNNKEKKQEARKTEETTEVITVKAPVDLIVTNTGSENMKTKTYADAARTAEPLVSQGEEIKDKETVTSSIEKTNTEKRSTEICRRYMNSNCKYGIRCRYEHPINNDIERYEITTKEKPSQKPCWHYFNKQCKFAYKCKFSHTLEPQKETIPPTSKQQRGLPNIEGNACFAIAPTHMLSRAVPLEKEIKGRAATILKKTANILNRKHEESSPAEISRLMWKFSTDTWPDYKKKNANGRNRQNDAAEYLMRLVSKLEEENEETTKCLKSAINSTTRCTNEKCSTPIESIIGEEHILRTTAIPDNTKISLQMIVDNFIPQLSTQRDTRCKKCNGINEVTNTLMQPTPVLMIQINKVLQTGNKTETEIEAKDEIRITTTENPSGVAYTLSDVIIHKGTTSNGHYITTHYDEHQGGWEVINDASCKHISNNEAEKINKHGVIYILRTKVAKAEPSKDKENTNQANKTINLNKEPEVEGSGHPSDNTQKTNKTTSKERTNPAGNNDHHTEDRRYKKDWEMIPKEHSSTKRNNPWSSTKRELTRYNSKSNKRRYLDRDDPNTDKLICWWHLQNRCKFGANCWYSHEEPPFL